MPKNRRPFTPYGRPASFKALLAQASFSVREMNELSKAKKESDQLTSLEQKAIRLTQEALAAGNFSIQNSGKKQSASCTAKNIFPPKLK